jgi:hypothetical protein
MPAKPFFETLYVYAILKGVIAETVCLTLGEPKQKVQRGGGGCWRHLRAADKPEFTERFCGNLGRLQDDIQIMKNGHP